MGWLTRLLGGGQQDEPFPLGAAVAVMAHPSACILHPVFRLTTRSGATSGHFMPAEYWSRVDADAAPDILGTALCAAFGRVETLSAQKWRKRQDTLRGKAHAGFDTAAYRAFLGLPKRAAVWADMRSVTVQVNAAGLTFAASKADGVPGGFAGFTPPRIVSCTSNAGDDLIGHALLQAIRLCA